MSVKSVAKLPSHLTQKKAVLVLVDIVQAVSIIRSIEDEPRWVAFIDGFYSLCSNCIREYGGEVIKYQGDACLALFDESSLEPAIDALIAIRCAFGHYCESCDIKPTDIRGVVHIGEQVFVGAFGPEGQKDVMGKAVGVLFNMEGRGISLSEQAYRKLPSAKRSPWRKQGGNVVYVMK